MSTARFHQLALAALTAAGALLLTSCGTTGTVANRKLPAYEPPLARNSFQTVRTTAYTHTELDHLAYGARNALGGQLRAATVPRGRVEAIPRALPVTSAISDSDYQTIAYTSRVPRSKAEKKRAKKEKTRRASKPKPPQIGSAAADWSRWPVGTTFRVLSTGQTYRVDDYGWALAGRNTIDLYMGSRNDMNRWGVRHEPIQVLTWGDPQQSLNILELRQSYKHCRRMVLELQGQHETAAALE